MKTRKHTYEEVLTHFGTQEEMAAVLHCNRTAVSQWRGGFPFLRTFQIEVVTKGKFKAAKLPVNNGRGA